jgi:hypothetical protein
VNEITRGTCQISSRFFRENNRIWVFDCGSNFLQPIDETNISLRRIPGMPIFQFDLIDGRKIAGTGGFPCLSRSEAELVADGLALRLARDEPDLIGEGYAVSVKTEDGDEIYRVEVDAINKRRAH